MVLSQSLLGEELTESIKEAFRIELHQSIWVLPRNSERNKQLKVTGMVISASFSNSLIGSALKNDANVLLLIERENLQEIIAFRNLMELLYKQNLFVLNLRRSWIFNTKVGLKFLAKVFCLSDVNVQLDSSNSSVIYFNMPYQIQIKSILTRFRTSIIFANESNYDSHQNINVFLLSTSSALSSPFIMKPDLIISTTLSYEIHTLCSYKKISLIYLDYNELLNEIAREISHNLSIFLKFSRVTFCSSHLTEPKLVD